MLSPVPIDGHQPVRELDRPSSVASYGSTSSIPRSDLSQDRVVARAISRHYNPSQLRGNVHHGTFISFLIVEDRANIVIRPINFSFL